MNFYLPTKQYRSCLFFYCKYLQIKFLSKNNNEKFSSNAIYDFGSGTLQLVHNHIVDL